MKNILIITCALLIWPSGILAQMTTPVRVRAGEDLYQKLAKEIYLYPAFTKGTILFRDGKMNEANFNYNLLNGEIQFITDTGDTLSLANELTIKYISIAKDSFFYDQGYLQLIAQNEAAKVAKKQIIKIIDHQKIGAYDQPSSAGAITSYTTMPGQLKNIKLDIRQDVILAKQTSFYISNKYSNFSRANKKNMFKIFHKKENELNEYFKNNNVDFNKEEDITRILEILKE